MESTCWISENLVKRYYNEIGFPNGQIQWIGGAKRCRVNETKPVASSFLSFPIIFPVPKLLFVDAQFRI